jgi:transcription initiation factor TFIIA large subunit
MPWDPKPVPPSNIKQEADSTANGGSNNVKPDVKYENQGPSQPDVKFENQGAAAYASMNGYAGGGVNPMAQQRAANNLIQQFGSVANASAQAVVQQPRSTVQNGATNPASQASESDAKPNVSAAQTDGAGDVQWAWQGTVDQIRDFEAERPVADGFFRSQMDATDAVANAGLMLNTAENRNALKKLQQQQAKAARRSGIPQVDGPDEEDEDAINSDLDDSEDEMEQEEDDDEGPLGEMILCTWDKVNRVKNKVRNPEYYEKLSKANLHHSGSVP